MTRITCRICPHHCMLAEGQTGFCRARSNRDGEISDDNYGKITALALDPIEKKPLYHFYPGSFILSLGSYGCNLRCSFCQNHDISMICEKEAHTRYLSPEELVEKALGLLPQGNIGVAFTYNEPLIGYEYVRDAAGLLKKQGLKTVVVTNGYIDREPLIALLPLIDAMNIDLKAFNEAFYRKISGDLLTVKNTIALAREKCHVEVTTLIIPGENDSPEEMRALSNWLSGLDEEIPLHLSRFFPSYQMAGKSPTPLDTISALAKIAREKLTYVYKGNC